MKIIKQGTYSNIVRRESENECVSDSYLMSSDFEGSVSLRFRVDTFEILDARWSIHRADDPERRGEGVAEMLIGESAYIDDKRNSIKVLPDYSYCTDYNMPPGGWDGVNPNKELLEDKPREEVSAAWRKIRELFLECLRGAYQAEAYLIEERGMGTLEEYEAYWEKLKPGYCRPYIPGDMPALDEWPIYSGNIQHYRTYDLYNKYLNYTVLDEENGNIYAAGTYNDSAHEMNIELVFDESGVVSDFDMTTVRVPFAPCAELNHLNPDAMLGLNIYNASKRDIGKILGGSTGCFHMVDIMADIIAALK